ncbi:hypothetical protein Hypma_009492 [Hypsizygus marmoreus]|uniref:Uncharacterized protein n=1 Tax=Hypsizygus marmoreus TaxID=39966 RepID=A0A369JRK2_HYPMA|nr:hypothetical protein Hypma_009492 [Hypsizygus marmoreus]
MGTFYHVEMGYVQYKFCEVERRTTAVACLSTFTLSQKMSDPETHQPNGKPQMSAKPSEGNLAKDVGGEFLKGVAEEGGEQTVKYTTETEEGQQHLEDAKTQAQGLWAKYCGCFASAV